MVPLTMILCSPIIEALNIFHSSLVFHRGNRKLFKIKIKNKNKEQHFALLVTAFSTLDHANGNFHDVN